jgi:hypothetical protein
MHEMCYTLISADSIGYNTPEDVCNSLYHRLPVDRLYTRIWKSNRKPLLQTATSATDAQTPSRSRRSLANPPRVSAHVASFPRIRLLAPNLSPLARASPRALISPILTGWHLVPMGKILLRVAFLRRSCSGICAIIHKLSCSRRNSPLSGQLNSRRTAGIFLAQGQLVWAK